MSEEDSVRGEGVRQLSEHMLHTFLCWKVRLLPGTS